MEPPKADFAETMPKLGETISGEHGIGHKRRDYMNIVMSEAHLDMMRNISESALASGPNPCKEVLPKSETFSLS